MLKNSENSIEKVVKKIVGSRMLKPVIGLWAIMTCVSLSACASSTAGKQQSPIIDESAEVINTGFILTGPESYDSADTAVVVNIDAKNNTITFLNLDLGRNYTLSVDGTSKLLDKYGEGISMDQLKKGDIVEVFFLKSKKHLTKAQLSPIAWCFNGVERYDLNTVRNEVTIGNEVYGLTDHTLYLSQGEDIELIELNAMDVLTFQGIDSTILSVSVDKGHGYLRLVNDENFVGGWIEIGQEHVQRITEDMLLTVPEGNYTVNISHNGGGGTKSVVIDRNAETILDIGDLKVKEAKQGKVVFTLTPATAKLYVDGGEVDASKPVTLDYGIHQIIAKADGYKSLTQYIRVGQESAGLDVVLDKDDNATTGSSSTGTSSTSTTASSSTVSTSAAVVGYYQVHIDSPEDVEVYLDGNYIGIAPCSFKKVSGSHEITLRKSGYETRDYTLLIDDEKKDVTYSFADLVKYQTVSGNDADDDD